MYIRHGYRDEYIYIPFSLNGIPLLFLNLILLRREKKRWNNFCGIARTIYIPIPITKQPKVLCIPYELTLKRVEVKTKFSRYSSSIDPLNVASTSAKVALLRMFAIIGFMVNTQVEEGLRE